MRHLPTPKVDIDMVLRRVDEEVFIKSKGKQNSVCADHSCLHFLIENHQAHIRICCFYVYVCLHVCVYRSTVRAASTKTKRAYCDGSPLYSLRRSLGLHWFVERAIGGEFARILSAVYQEVI